MSELTILPSADLTPRQRAEVLDLCSRAFEEDYAPYLRGMPDPTHVLAYADGVLVSHACWITRQLQYNNGVMLRTAYVEGVATDPAHQGRGYATAVMRALQAAILDFDLAALSPFDVSWYARLGWESWHGPLSIRTSDGLLPTPDETVMILRLPGTPALDPMKALSAEWREGEMW